MNFYIVKIIISQYRFRYKNYPVYCDSRSFSSITEIYKNLQKKVLNTDLHYYKYETFFFKVMLILRI